MDTLNQTLRATGDIHLKGKISCQNHFVLLCDATAKSFTVNLPDAKSVRNICIIIVKTDTSTNTVTGLCDIAGQKVNGLSTSVLSSQGVSMMLFPCGADGYWYKGGQLTAAQISALHPRLHALDSPLDHSSTIDQGYLMLGDVNGLPAQSVIRQLLNEGPGLSDNVVMDTGSLKINSSSNVDINSNGVRVIGYSPAIELYNKTLTDDFGGRASALLFYGQDSTFSGDNLARVEARHHSSDTDKKGALFFAINTGSGLVDLLTVAWDGITLGNTVNAVRITPSQCSVGYAAWFDLSTNKTNLSGKVNIYDTPEYPDNAAALTAGLVAGDVYRTGDILKVVH
jgi:hypothetical protein